MTPIDAAQLTQTVYFRFNVVLIISCIVGAWVLKELFMRRLGRINNIDQHRFINLSWGWMMAEAVMDIQAFNIVLYIFWNSGSPIPVKYLADNLPDKTSQLILLIGYLLLIPVIRKWKVETDDRALEP
jgi:hypothetical protein